MKMKTKEILLSVKNLSTHFVTDSGVAKAVDNVSFDIERGRTLALVGESACGKTTIALSILRLIPDPPGKIVNGRILLGPEDILKMSKKRLRTVRGNDIAIIFQTPETSLNPVYTVGSQVAEAISLHQGKKQAKAWDSAVEMIASVGIDSPEQRARCHPHQLSGGMCQRIMIAMALSSEPKLLIADEPTTALDVTIQAQILQLLAKMRRRSDMSILLITHDLAVVAQNADDVAVMYASKIVERASTGQIFSGPKHPYTQALLRSLPRLDSRDRKMEHIAGSAPEALSLPSGCRFHPRCPIGACDRRCQTLDPTLCRVAPGWSVACWYADGYESKNEHK